MWRDGRSSGEIADAKGVTRNAVIGILQRLGEDRRTQGRGASAKALPKPKLASVPLASPTVSAEPRPISLAVVKAAATIQISDGGVEGHTEGIRERPAGATDVRMASSLVRVTPETGDVASGNPGKPVLKPGPSETISKVDKRAFRYEWAPERNEMLRRLFANGVPIRRIAVEMKTTRVTVRTKMKLLGIVRERPPTPTLDQRMEAPAPLLNKPATAAPARPLMRTPEISQPISDSAPVTFFDLEKCMCRWPLPHAADDEALYCGENCESRASYCDAHADVATQPKYRRPRGASGERLPIGRSVTASVSRSV